MKTLRTIPTLIVTLLVCIGLLFSATSCAVAVKRDNGTHRGYHKNPNKPHHQNRTNPGNDNRQHKRSYKNPNKPHHRNSSNPGKSKGKSKKMTAISVDNVFAYETVGQNEEERMPGS